MVNVKNFAEQLVNLSIKEVTELAKILKDEYGIEPAATQVVVEANTTGPSAGGSTGEKNTFDVILKSAGTQKLAVVKAVKDLLGLGLKEAKELVDAAPKSLKEGVVKIDAENLKKSLEEHGAEVEIK